MPPIRTAQRGMGLTALVAAGLISLHVTVLAAQAALEGDVYLVTKSGDVKLGAALDVFLIRVSTRVAQQWRSLCREQEARSTVAYAEHDSLLAATTDLSAKQTLLKAEMARIIKTADINADERSDMLKRLAISSAPTGMKAHYRFSKVAAGTYWLLATMGLGEDHHLLRKVVVRTGSVTVDLDNKSIDGLPPCDKPLP